MQAQVEELAENRVRMTVQVPSHDVHHAVEHAASDLADRVKIPGFRKGKVPHQVLVQRIGRERLMTEAVESHIGGWFWNAATRKRVRPVAQPEYDFELPASDREDWQFTATFPVQAKPELPDWTTLEVGAVEPEVPDDLVQEELDELRAEIEQRLLAEITDEVEAQFRSDVADALVAATRFQPSAALVADRTRALLASMARRAEAMGTTLETYLALSGQQPDALLAGLQEEAALSLARELVLEAAADTLEIVVDDEQLEALVREQAESLGDDAESMLARLRESGRFEQLREDLRLRDALDRIASEVKRIPKELAEAREQIWTPDKEKQQPETKLWT